MLAVSAESAQFYYGAHVFERGIERNTKLLDDK